MANSSLLLRFVERIERLNGEIAELQYEKRGVIAEAKSVGFDGATIGRIVARRKVDPAVRADADLLLRVYEAELGMGDEPEEDGADAAAETLAVKSVERKRAQLAAIAALLPPEAEAQLVAIIARLLDLRGQRSEITNEISVELKAAAKAGFSTPRIGEVCQRYEKIEKHGREAVLAAEAAQAVYADAFDRAGAADAIGQATSDPKLQQMLGQPAPSRAQRTSKALERMRAQASAARRAREG